MSNFKPYRDVFRLWAERATMRELLEVLDVLAEELDGRQLKLSFTITNGGRVHVAYPGRPPGGVPGGGGAGLGGTGDK